MFFMRLRVSQSLIGQGSAQAFYHFNTKIQNLKHKTLCKKVAIITKIAMLCRTLKIF